jgi:hypothetical protein
MACSRRRPRSGFPTDLVDSVPGRCLGRGEYQGGGGGGGGGEVFFAPAVKEVDAQEEEEVLLR